MLIGWMATAPSWFDTTTTSAGKNPLRHRAEISICMMKRVLGDMQAFNLRAWSITMKETEVRRASGCQTPGITLPPGRNGAGHMWS
jgi:hypothetical protein